MIFLVYQNLVDAMFTFDKKLKLSRKGKFNHLTILF
jgi:hypothetical protein